MKGFNPKFKDLPDYIIGITKEIWEDRGIATLHHYYAQNIPMRFPAGLVRGNQAVIEGTRATLAQFPDRQLLGEDVIWSGNEDDGFLSSHRLLTTGTHLGDGDFGPPTGKRFWARCIADCAAKNDQIYDEWLIRDSGAIVRQLGMDPKEFACANIEAEGGPENCTRPFTPDQDVDGGYNARGNDHEFGQRYADVIERIMAADMTAVRGEYDRACHVELPGFVTGHGWDSIDQFWLQLRSSFPSAKFEIHHQIGRDDPNMPPRAALRWSLHGKHDGYGMFGAPTGAEVYVMGFGHAEFGPRGLRREYILIEETSIWKQILMHQG